MKSRTCVVTSCRVQAAVDPSSLSENGGASADSGAMDVDSEPAPVLSRPATKHRGQQREDAGLEVRGQASSGVRTSKYALRRTRASRKSTVGVLETDLVLESKLKQLRQRICDEANADAAGDGLLFPHVSRPIGGGVVDLTAPCHRSKLFRTPSSL